MPTIKYFDKNWPALLLLNWKIIGIIVPVVCENVLVRAFWLAIPFMLFVERNRFLFWSIFTDGRAFQPQNSLLFCTQMIFKQILCKILQGENRRALLLMCRGSHWCNTQYLHICSFSTQYQHICCFRTQYFHICWCSI